MLHLGYCDGLQLALHDKAFRSAPLHMVEHIMAGNPGVLEANGTARHISSGLIPISKAFCTQDLARPSKFSSMAMISFIGRLVFSSSVPQSRHLLDSLA
jgi:hypothetical protein